MNGFAHLELGNVDFDQFGEVAGTAFYADFVLVDFEDAVFVLDAVGFAGEVERKNRMHWLAPDDFDKVNVFDGAREGIAGGILYHRVARFRTVGECQFYENRLTRDLLQGRNEALFFYQEVLFPAFAVDYGGDLAAFAIAFRGIAAYLSPDG